MNEQQHSEGLDLSAIWGILRRRAGLIVLAVVLTAGVALGYSLVKEKQYTAEASLLFRDPALDQKLFGSSFSSPYQDPSRQAETNQRLASLDVVAARAARRVGHGLTSGDVSSEVKVTAEGDSDLATIRATDPDPPRAAAIANAFAAEYILFRRNADRAKIREAQTLVQRELDRLSSSQPSSRVRTLERRAEDLKVLGSLQTGNAELVQRASAPGSPSAPRPRRNTLIGAFVGLLLGLGLALSREQLDRRLRHPDEVERVTGLPILASVPKSRVFEPTRDGRRVLPPHEGEAFRMLRANMRYFKIDREIRSVLITSAAPKDGKSTVALNLALAAAETGTRTLLLEADLRAPSLGRLLGISADRGLTTLLSDSDRQLSDVGWRVPVGQGLNGHTPQSATDSSLDVLFAGPPPPNPTELLESSRMSNLLQEAEEEYSLVIVDAPPFTSVSDAIPLLNQVSGVIVVSRLGTNTRTLMRRLTEQLQNIGAPTLGIVVNFATEKDPLYYGYGYGAAGDGGRRKPLRVRQ